jgi:hypothetical protein
MGPARCNSGKNITTQSAGLALAAVVVMQRFGRSQGRSGHCADIVILSLLTPERTLGVVNCCIAKRLPDYLVGGVAQPNSWGFRG